MPPGLFCPKFHAEKLLFDAFLGIMRNFGSVQPKSESLLFFILSRSNCILVLSYFHYSPLEQDSFGHIHEYTFHISSEFRIWLMLPKNKPRNPLTLRANADPAGEKCCKSKKKGARNAKKVTRNTPLYASCFSHFAIVFAYFAISI